MSDVLADVVGAVIVGQLSRSELLVLEAMPSRREERISKAGVEVPFLAHRRATQHSLFDAVWASHHLQLASYQRI